jgi:hypothetical protein
MHTPGLDKLASNAMLFHKNYVQQAVSWARGFAPDQTPMPTHPAPPLTRLRSYPPFNHQVCSPTRTSLLTSRRPDATRVWDLYTWVIFLLFATMNWHRVGINHWRGRVFPHPAPQQVLPRRAWRRKLHHLAGDVSPQRLRDHWHGCTSGPSHSTLVYPRRPLAASRPRSHSTSPHFTFAAYPGTMANRKFSTPATLRGLARRHARAAPKATTQLTLGQSRIFTPPTSLTRQPRACCPRVVRSPSPLPLFNPA